MNQPYISVPTPSIALAISPERQPPPRDCHAGTGSGDAAPSLVPGSAPVPAEQVLPPRADQVHELGKLAERLDLLSVEMMTRWHFIYAAQDAAGWPDIDVLRGTTNRMFYSALDLSNVLEEFHQKLSSTHYAKLRNLPR